MSNTISSTTAIVPVVRLNAPAKAPRPTAPSATPDANAMPAAAKVDMAYSRVAYDASLDALRNANKIMMGYLLNIKV